MKGLYCLCLRSCQEQTIQIGKLGTFTFPSGFYYYIGSAFNSLHARVARYFKPIVKKHWHIDYVLSEFHAIDVIKIQTEKRLECSLNQLIHKKFNTTQPVKKFGSSDCSCFSHLHYSKTNINIDDIKGVIYEELDTDLCFCK